MKYSSKMWDNVVHQSMEIARKSFEELETRATDEPFSASTTCPCLQAIVDAFKVVYEAIVVFQASHEPTLHKILLSLQY